MLKLATKFQPETLALETAYRAGFRYAELWLDASVLANWQTALEHVRYYPNGYVLHFPNSLDLSADLLKNTVTLYRRLDCRCMVIHQPMYDKFRRGLLALDPNLRLAVENHKLTPSDLENWAESNTGLTLDVEHLWKFTLRDGSLEDLLKEMRRLVTRLGDKLLHIHLPGYWPGFDEHRPMYCAREMIFPVLSILADASFEGLVVSEVDRAFQNISELRMDVLLLESWRNQSAQSP
jgi:sugar phosphate isomerase/epimerase